MATVNNIKSPDTLISIKISLNDGSLKKLKLPLKDLNASVLPEKLRLCLNIAPDSQVIFERFSDSAGGFILLDPSNVPVYKALVRAAKAKGKLRLRAVVMNAASQTKKQKTEEPSAIEETIPSAAAPVIVHSAPNVSATRESTALDRRSIGTGIFKFREARASNDSADDEAPVPQPFTASKESIELKPSNSVHHNPASGTQETKQMPMPYSMMPPPTFAAWSVYCNVCDVAMADAHYHCSICDGGDYDLCENCVNNGKVCLGQGHWLIKRFIKDGKVVNSTTERFERKFPKEAEKDTKEMPGTFTEETKVLADEPRLTAPTRTCNNCVVVLPEREFVTCNVCDDFDLCINCHIKNQHGHHPGHTFKPATEETTLPLISQALLTSGRNVPHNAFCDGCQKRVFGVRHKCLNCPDWDFCNECVANASTTHPGHRFAPIYDQLVEPQPNFTRHFGIYCDGPLCNKGANAQSYIQGVRYKCAVCNDTDFCAACEALPSNTHNRTHPLIKFQTPVRNVSITTLNEDLRGNVRNMGDRRPQPSDGDVSVGTNTATPVHTVAEIKPTEVKAPEPKLVAETPSGYEALPQTPTKPDTEVKSEPIVSRHSPVPANLLTAIFVRDSVTDGTVMQPGARFTQIWTLRNEGPHIWPAGCSVRFVGGDNMLNVDNGHPASVTDIAEATESSVVGREVQVGEEISFKITLKAPMREGKSISYWRLKSADGTPFGHRLWCDIEVRRPKPVAGPSVTAPAFDTADTFQPHQSYEIPVRSWNPRSEAMRQTHLRMLQHQQMLAQQRVLAQPQTANTFMQYQMASRANQHQQQRQFIPMRGSPPHQVAYSKPSTSEEDKASKDAAKLRIDAIKAKILRGRAERLMAAETSTSASKAVEENVNEGEVSQTTTDQKPTQVVDNSDHDESVEKDVPSNSSSVMVFPKLEKESPTSSIIASAPSKGKAAYIENEKGEVESSAAPTAAVPNVAVESTPASPADGFEDLEDDLEVLSASGVSDEDEDDGFLTDEEYDILDASDRETVTSP